MRDKNLFCFACFVNWLTGLSMHYRIASSVKHKWDSNCQEILLTKLISKVFEL